MTFRTTLIGAAVLAATLDSGALTLGPVRGTAVLGQPVDLTFEVRLDSVGDAACVSAEVFHADNPVDPARVRAAVVPGASGLDVAVRVLSSAAIDEPVVTVGLRAGCTQSASRRYVLLAEPPADLRTNAANSRFGPALPMPVVPQTALLGAPGAGTPGNAGGASPGASGPAAALAPVRPRVRPPRAPTPTASEAAPAAPRAAVPRPPPEPANRPRLRLDPADLEAERDAFLRPSYDLPSLPADDPQRRADAAALWRALNTQPQDVLRDAKRLETLEADTKSLRELTLRNQAAMAQLQNRVDDTAPGRFGNPLLLGLAALLALALAALVWLWLRSRGLARARHWWQDSGPGVSRSHSTVVRDGAPSMFPPGMAALSPGMPLDVDLSALGDDPLPAPTAVPARSEAPTPAAVAPVQPRSERTVHPEELFDIQQQADFFVSLGQYDQAVEVLQQHIDEAPARSPLAYLDLLKIFHTLSRSADYQRVRDAFNSIFNGEVPEFAGFNRVGRALETYPEVLDRIQSVWGRPAASVAIEDLMFRQPDQRGAAFDLDAYRELLLLHAVAKSLAPRTRTGGGGFNDVGGPLFSDSRPAPMVTLPVAPKSDAPSRSTTDPMGPEPTLEWPSRFPALEPSGTSRVPGTTPMGLPGSGSVDLDLGSDPPAPSSPDRSRRDAVVLDVPAHPVLARMLPDDPTMPSEVSPAEAVDSHLIDFDLFDTGGDGKPNLPKP